MKLSNSCILVHNYDALKGGQAKCVRYDPCLGYAGALLYVL